MGNSNNKKEETRTIINSNISNVENRISASNDYNQSQNFNDNISRIKQSLKYLHKNNFTSLTFEDLNAYYIQINWKQHVISSNREKRKGMIEVIYSSLDSNSNVTSRQDRLFVLLDSKRHPYRCYDLMTYTSLKHIVEQYGGYKNLPAVFINNFYIGSADSFQELEDLKLTTSIVSKEYSRRCLMCNVTKTNPDLFICPYCYKKYTFFAKDSQLINIHQNRSNVGDIIYFN